MAEWCVRHANGDHCQIHGDPPAKGELLGVIKDICAPAASPSPPGRQEAQERLAVLVEAVRAVGAKGHWDVPHWNLIVPHREITALFDLAYEDATVRALAPSPSPGSVPAAEILRLAEEWERSRVEDEHGAKAVRLRCAATLRALAARSSSRGER